MGIESGEQSYIVIMLPGSINFVFYQVFCKHSCVPTVTLSTFSPRNIKDNILKSNILSLVVFGDAEKSIRSEGYFES